MATEINQQFITPTENVENVANKVDEAKRIQNQFFHYNEQRVLPDGTNLSRHFSVRNSSCRWVGMIGIGLVGLMVVYLILSKVQWHGEKTDLHKTINAVVADSSRCEDEKAQAKVEYTMLAKATKEKALSDEHKMQLLESKNKNLADQLEMMKQQNDFLKKQLQEKQLQTTTKRIETSKLKSSSEIVCANILWICFAAVITGFVSVIA